MRKTFLHFEAIVYGLSLEMFRARVGWGTGKPDVVGGVCAHGDWNKGGGWNKMIFMSLLIQNIP